MALKKCSILILILILSFTSYAGKFSAVDDIIKVFRKSFKYNNKISKKFINKAIIKHGDDFVVLSKKYGPKVVKITQKYGDEGFDIIRKYGDSGIKAVNNYGEESFKLIAKYGDDVVPVISKYNKINLKILKNYGDDIIKLDKKLPREKIISIMGAADLDKTGKYTEKIIENGEKIISFIEKHPKFFIGVPITTAIYKVITNEELSKKAMEEVGMVGKSIVNTGKDTVLGLAGGENNLASVIRATILSVGIIIILYSLLTRKLVKKQFVKNGKYKKQTKNEEEL